MLETYPLSLTTVFTTLVPLLLFFNTLQRILSTVLSISPYPSSVLCSFVFLILSFVLFICSYSLGHNLSHLCSFLHPQYLTDLEEEVRKLCVHFLQKKIFRAWFNMVREAKIDFQSKQKVAVEHNDRWGFALQGNSLTDFTIALQYVLRLEYIWKDEVEARRAGHMERYQAGVGIPEGIYSLLVT